jgi:cytochrome d ubiquinol oxidase subunit I
VIGLDTVALSDRPPDDTLLHWSFDAMVGICTLLIGLGIWLAIGWWRKIDFARSRWFLRATALSGVAAVVALECGWIVTEVGRQPWIVYDVMRTSDAVTQANGIWVTFTAVLVLYALLGATLVLVLLTMSRRWREADGQEPAVPYGPDPSPATVTGSTG